MISKKKLFVWSALLAVVVAAVLAFSFLPVQKKDVSAPPSASEKIQTVPEPQTAVAPMESVADAAPAVETNRVSRWIGRHKEITTTNAPVEMSDADYRLIEDAFKETAALTGFLDDGDPVKTINEARGLLKSRNREVRMEVVKALDWIGLPAAMDLAGMIDDSDPEIRKAAQDAFWDAMDEAEKPDLKQALLTEALKSSSPDVRTKALDEAAQLPDSLSFGMMVSAMNDADEAVAEQARSAMSFISGENFETKEQAQAWFKENKAGLQAAEDDVKELFAAPDTSGTSKFFQRKKLSAKSGSAGSQTNAPRAAFSFKKGKTGKAAE